ncbi:MAG: PhoX family phosphatase [Pseudomonadota bacterium]
MDEQENTPSNPRVSEGATTIGALIEARLSRRGFVAGLSAAAVMPVAACSPAEEAAVVPVRRGAFDFPEITRGMDEMHHVPEGYRADILLRWGDPLFDDSPAFDAFAQSADAQERQFGYNNDFVGYWPLEPGEDGAQRGLLCVNHEYTTTRLMLPGLEGRGITREECDVELAAHGGTIVEIQQGADGLWQAVVGSPYNRRVTTRSTEMELTGPAAGSERLQTTEDPAGRLVIGTMNNCAGGITPWGTYLMSEENFNGNFLGALPEDHPEAANHARYGVPGGWYSWGRHFDRFDVSKEPNEPNRFGWIVEVDILDPQSSPKKRTALGRFKHEGAESIIAPDGRVVVYMGDDQRFDYVYKFVSAGVYTLDDRDANMDLLENGTLYAARFDEDGTVVWLPLIFGEGPLTPENSFGSQADVLIEARRAADLLGATPMDRPEDVEPHPTNGRVYVMLTNNNRRAEEQVDAANPRANNTVGHVIEIIEPEGDFTATRSRWEILVRCGDPSDPEAGATWNSATSENGWFGSPDNCAIDPNGRLWVSTDGNHVTGAADGLWALATDGDERGTGRAFFRAPTGAELCGPRFTQDGKSLFVAVQHPGDGRGASFEAPTTRWPDFVEGQPPRPSVMVVRRDDGGAIG